MNKPRTIEGRWWIDGADKPAHFGILTYDPEDGLSLTVKIPQSRTVDAFMIEHATRGWPEISRIIHGADEHDQSITLFGCAVVNHSTSCGLKTFTIHPIACLLKAHFNSWEAAKFTTAEVHYTLLHRWLNRNILESVKCEDKRPAVRIKLSDELIFAVGDGNRLRIDQSIEMHDSIEESRYYLNHRIWFHFAEAKNVEVICEDFVAVFQRFLSLLTGERVFVETVRFFEHDPFIPGSGGHASGVELLQANHGVSQANRNMHSPLMVAPFNAISAQFGPILCRWFTCHKELEPVVDLYSVVFTNRSLCVENQFLFLAQALEVYHARSRNFTSSELPSEQDKNRVTAILDTTALEHRDWLKEKLAFSNQKTLARRIDDILSFHRQEADRLTSRIENFPSKVRHTRNYYTHYNEDSQKKAAKGRELWEVTAALEALLQVCLLKEIGITGAPIERILKKYAEMWFVDLATGFAGSNAAQSAAAASKTS
ncbi:MAG: HEPN domain-containing protein [Verrucomicrobiia bacterium]